MSADTAQQLMRALGMIQAEGDAPAPAPAPASPPFHASRPSLASMFASDDVPTGAADGEVGSPTFCPPTSPGYTCTSPCFNPASPSYDPSAVAARERAEQGGLG